METIGSQVLEENVGWECCKRVGVRLLLSGKGKKTRQLKLCCPAIPWEPHPASSSDW